MTVALNDMEQIFYGKSCAEYLEEFDNTETADSVEPTVIKAVAQETRNMGVHNSQRDLML